MQHILLIEDNDEIRENTAEILELAGYTTDTAANGKLGVEQAMKQKPDLIICDIMMPVLDGYGVLHLLSRNADLSSVPFIFLSAKAERSDLRKGMEMGADDYITKPFTDIELLTAIESRLKKTSILKQQYHNDPSGIRQMLHDFTGKDELEIFAADRNTDKYKKKQVIYNIGNHPTRLFYLLKGKVKCFKTNDDGKELITDLYGPGDFFGYTAILEGRVYHETAEAIEESEVAIIPKEEFDELIGSNAHVAHKLISMLVKNVREKEEQLLGLAYNSLRKRVADALLTLQKKYQQENESSFAIQIAREDLANIAGTATESLIRTLADFKNEALIEIRDGYIIIKDEKKLTNLVN